MEENERENDGKCMECKMGFDDFGKVIICTECKFYFHGKCQNIDMRGFHMKRSTWVCSRCENNSEIVTNIDTTGRARKRSRVEDTSLEKNVFEIYNSKMENLIMTVKEMNKKIDYLIGENAELKKEVLSLKTSNAHNAISINSALTSSASTIQSYASVTKNDNQVLVVKQKSSTSQKDVKQVRDELKQRVNPTDLGAGISIGKPTKNGGIILECGNEKELSNIQTAIQEKLGDDYVVDRPKILNHRIKVVGLDETEFNMNEESLISKLVKQNSMNGNVQPKLKLVRKTNIANKRFNIVLEVDADTYNHFIERQKMNIGWNRCWVYNDYGIIRCFKCCRYGHFSKDCKESKICPKCSESHDGNECTNTVPKCVNCVLSNKKYGLNLDTEHVVWDVSKCECYKRIEQTQKKKYIK